MATDDTPPPDPAAPPFRDLRDPHPPLEPPGRAALERAWREQRVALVVLLGLSAVLALVLIALGERVSHRDRILPGITAGPVDVGGRSETEALADIQRFAAHQAQTPLHVTAGDHVLSLDPRTIGYRVDATATVRAARRDGRSGNPIANLTGVPLRAIRHDEVPLVVHYDQDQLGAALDTWVGATGKGLVDGSLRFDGAQVAEISPRAGIGIDRDEAERRILGALRSGATDLGSLAIGRTRPTIDRAELARAARRARRLLAAPVHVTAGTQSLTVTPAQLGPTLGTRIVDGHLALRVDPAALRSALGPTLATVETAPKDATWSIDGTAATVVPSVDGVAVDLDGVARAVAAGNHRVRARLTTSHPARTTEWAQKLNIHELVGTFTTNHPCCQPRVTNIHKGADVINGTVVEPGQTFSLNQALGPRTTEKGYVLAPGIGANLEFEDSVGGGVSQLSTTLFNAVFFGCYQDVTHTVHALYISRYPMGREATLNYPSIDNQFRDDTKSGVLIRTFYDNGSITVSLYGDKEGRRCTAEGPHILQTIPVETQYVDDPAQPVGKEKELDPGHTGYVVENFRIIHRDGQPDVRQRFVEKYSMAKRKVARGVAPLPPAPTTPTTVAGATPPPS